PRLRRRFLWTVDGRRKGAHDQLPECGPPDGEVPRKGRSVAAPRDRTQQTSVLMPRPAPRDLAGFRRAGRLRSRDFRPDQLEDILGPAVPRATEAADRPHLLDVAQPVREDPIIDVGPERFSEEHGLDRQPHGAPEAAPD